MKARAEILPTQPAASESEPSLPAIVLIFWFAFAVAIVATRIMNPVLFESQDPDSFLRIVQVRDLLAGQGWFDLVQHRMDPPGGALLQWSRLIDAPLAFLVLLGNAVGLGETLATTLWPTLLLLGLMGSAAAIASALAGRAAAVATLILVLFFLDPLILYLPGDIDHHNAQIVVTMATVAFALRLRAGPLFGVLAGAGSALTLAIGLEMLPHVVALGAIIALRFVWTGEDSRAVAAYGFAIGVLPGVLYLLTGSRAEAMACDSLSLSLAIPALMAGVGLGAWALVTAGRGDRPARLIGVLLVGAAAAGWFVGVTPQCLGGPYGQLSPEVKAAFLDTVSEAQPIWQYARREPVGAIGSVGPLLVALYVAIRHLPRDATWTVPTVLLLLATALSFYQVRTLPFASVLAIPVAGVWLAEVHARVKDREGRMRRGLPLAAVFLLAIPYGYLLVGWGGEKALERLSDGRVAPATQAKIDPALVKGLSTAEQNCFDPGAAALFAEVPKGLVLSPLFYGSTVLMLSDHSVVAGPYHRNGVAILDTINAMHSPPAEAKAIIERRGVDYVVVCSVAQESAIAANKAPEGLLAELQAGRTPGWLEPVPAAEPTKLRLWKIVKPPA